MKQSLRPDLLERDGVLERMAVRPARLVYHRLETGLGRMDPRPGDQDLAPLRPLLAKALRMNGCTVKLQPRWRMAATESGDRLEAWLWYWRSARQCSLYLPGRHASNRNETAGDAIKHGRAARTERAGAYCGAGGIGLS